MSEEELTPQKIADEVLELVRQKAPGEPGIETKDRNDRLLCAAYGRVYRCFTSIRRLAAEGAADDALVLARTLLSTVVKSIYLVQPEDPKERELRFRRATLTYVEQRKKFADEMRAAGFDTEAPEQLEEIATRLRKDGVTPLPPEKELADALDLGHFYTRIYRPGSDVTHYALGSMLDGFLERTTDELDTQLEGTVSLEMPDQEKADEVLMMAAITYGVFLEHSEKVIGHGLTEQVRSLMLRYHGYE